MVESTNLLEVKYINQLKDKLSPIEYEIFKMHLGLENNISYTIEEISEILNISVKKIYQIQNIANRKIRYGKRNRISLTMYLENMDNSVFGKHPSVKIQEIFNKRPFQIQEPEKAKIIFLGFDANLDANIEQDEIFFNKMLQYLYDGIRYWKRKGYHTPMLDPEYKGGGRKYHIRFNKLGFTKENAEDICFTELLNYCTYGNRSKNISSYMKIFHSAQNQDHLERIKSLFKLKNVICMPKGVKALIDKENIFDTKNKKIITHTHLSYISNKELLNLQLRLKEYIANI